MFERKTPGTKSNTEFPLGGFSTGSAPVSPQSAGSAGSDQLKRISNFIVCNCLEWRGEPLNREGCVSGPMRPMSDVSACGRWNWWLTPPSDPSLGQINVTLHGSFQKGVNTVLFNYFNIKVEITTIINHHCLYMKPKGNVYSVPEDRLSKEFFIKMANGKRHFQLKQFKFWNTQFKCSWLLFFYCIWW